MDVYVSEEWSYAHMAHYKVWVSGEVYDEFTANSRPHLTYAQMVDVANGYAEALSHYRPCI